jgi:hypothetical protein
MGKQKGSKNDRVTGNAGIGKDRLHAMERRSSGKEMGDDGAEEEI